MSEWMFLLAGLGAGAVLTRPVADQWRKIRADRTRIPTSAAVPPPTDRLPEWTWTVSLSGVFTSIKSASTDILGYQPSELIDRNIALVIDPHELARASAVVQATGIPESGLTEVVVLARHRDGSNRWCELTVVEQTDSAGTVVGHMGGSRQISPEAAQVVRATQTRSRVERLIADRMLMTSFQPIVDLATSRVVGVEALSRFVAEPGDTPEALFTDATTVGMGRELELLAIGTALTTAVALPEYLYVSINVSPLTCLDDRLENIVRNAAIDLGRIVLELTEHTEVTDYRLLNEGLQRLRRSGVRIAVDDAGAGFASGQHILKVKPDIIKLDRGLITDIDTDLGVRVLAAGMVAMADQIGASVTAEGIETPAELKSIIALGVTAGQGFLLGRPSVMPAEWAQWNSPGPIPQLQPLSHQEPAGEERRPDRVQAEPTPSFAVAVLDALPDATAILDPAGRIIAVNKTWRMFAEDNGGTPDDTGVGVSYIDVCVRAAASGVRDAVEVLAGLRAVLARDAVEREWEYTCSTPSMRRWYICKINRIDAEQGGAVVSHVNISRRKRSEEELAHQASHDPLTGLANRLLFTETLTQALQRRPGRGLHADVGLLYIDLDDFKPVNDAYGHAAGDELLLMTTHRLRTSVRPQDTVARLGGDEFVVCAPRISAKGLNGLASRIAVALSEPVQIHRQRLVISASVGVHLATAGDDAAGALHCADLAMYKIKSTRSGAKSLAL